MGEPLWPCHLRVNGKQFPAGTGTRLRPSLINACFPPAVGGGERKREVFHIAAYTCLRYIMALRDSTWSFLHEIANELVSVTLLPSFVSFACW